MTKHPALTLFLVTCLFFLGARIVSAADAGVQGNADNDIQQKWAETMKGMQPKPAAEQPELTPLTPEPSPELAPLQPDAPPDLPSLPPINWTGQVTLTWKLVVTPPKEEQETEHAINWSLPRPGKGLTRSTFKESTDYRAVVNLVPAEKRNGESNVVGTLNYEYAQTTESYARQPVYCRTPSGPTDGEVTRTGEYKIYTVNGDYQQGKAEKNLVGGDGRAWVEWQAGDWVLHLTVKDVEVNAELYTLWKTICSCDPPKKDDEPFKPSKEGMTIKSIPFQQDIPTGDKNSKAIKLAGSKNIPLKDTKGNPYIATVKWDVRIGQVKP
jgi:hypothetical protein